MTLTLNGETRLLADGTTLSEFLAAELPTTRGTAAAVNGEIVPRAQWLTFILAEGHAIEVVTAVQGG